LQILRVRYIELVALFFKIYIILVLIILEFFTSRLNHLLLSTGFFSDKNILGGFLYKQRNAALRLLGFFVGVFVMNRGYYIETFDEIEKNPTQVFFFKKIRGNRIIFLWP